MTDYLAGRFDKTRPCYTFFMHNHDRKVKNKKILILVTVISLLVIMAGVAGFIIQDGIVAEAGKEVSDKNKGKPRFVYDYAQQEGWLTAGNVWHDPADAADSTIEVEWPIADISVHRCKVASQCEIPEKDTIGGDCFVTASYNKSQVDPQKAVAEKIEENRKFDMTVQEVGVKTLTMSTPEGTKEYQLHKFDFAVGGDEILRGNALGFIALNKGHIDVRSVCAETSQLDETLPALQAIRLES